MLGESNAETEKPRSGWASLEADDGDRTRDPQLGKLEKFGSTTPFSRKVCHGTRQSARATKWNLPDLVVADDERVPAFDPPAACQPNHTADRRCARIFELDRLKIFDRGAPQC